MKKIWILLMLFWFLLTLSFSTDQKLETGKKSDYFVKLINPYIEKVCYKINKPTPKKEKVGKIIRKTAHFLNYTVFGMIILAGLKKSKVKKLVLFSVIIGVFFASIDEYYQTFVPGREGKISDVLIDASGIVFGILIISMFSNQFWRKNVSRVTLL